MNAGPADRRGSGWRACVPELVIAAVLIAATATAAYGYAGPAAAGLVLAGWAVASLLLLRLLVPPSTSAAPVDHAGGRSENAASSFIGFWRKRSTLIDGTASMASYDAQLGETLQHLFAARLAERHGINLYADPEAARQVAFGNRESDLWYWLDPQRARVTDQTKRGIPPRTLAAIIDRLERL